MDPYSYGWTARFLGDLGRDRDWFRLEEGVRRMTSFSAQRLGLRDRGLLREGSWADVAVFDPATIAPNDTFFDPARYPTGIEYLLVNGQVVLDHSEHTGARPGQVLRPS